MTQCLPTAVPKLPPPSSSPPPRRPPPPARSPPATRSPPQAQPHPPADTQTMPSPGPSVYPGTAYNIFGYPGFCTSASDDSFLTCSATSLMGDTPAEQFVAASLDGSSGPILPGQSVLWVNSGTGKYCTAAAAAGDKLCMQCTASSPSQATTFTWSSTGVMLNDQQLLVPPGGGTPCFAPAVSAPPTPVTPAPSSATPQGYPLSSNIPHNIFGGPGYCQLPDPSGFITCCSTAGNGTTPAEQFIPIPAAPGLIQPGQQLGLRTHQPVLPHGAGPKQRQAGHQMRHGRPATSHHLHIQRQGRL